MKKIILIISIIIALFLTTGCWDMVEINQRIFPYSVAVDLNEGEGEKYLVTISYLNINAIGKNAIQDQRVFVVSTKANSVFQAAKQLSTRIPYPFYFKHLRVLLIGEELAKDGHQVRQMMDGMSRDFIINKKIQIVMAEDKAGRILETVPKSTKQEKIEGTLFSMLRDGKKASRFSSKTLTDFVQTTDSDGIAIVPIMTVNKDEIVVFGGAIFKDYCFIGKIDEIENRSISLMRDMVKSELIDIPYKGATISYAISGQSVKRKLIQEDKNLVMKLDIEIEGALQEYIIRDHIAGDDLKIIKEMEEALNGEVKKEIDRTLEVIQKKYKADAIGVGEYISNFHPKLWKQIEKDWEEIFSQMEIDVNIDTKIRRRGLVK